MSCPTRPGDSQKTLPVTRSIASNSSPAMPNMNLDIGTKRSNMAKKLSHWKPRRPFKEVLETTSKVTNVNCDTARRNRTATPAAKEMATPDEFSPPETFHPGIIGAPVPCCTRSVLLDKTVRAAPIAGHAEPLEDCTTAATNVATKHFHQLTKNSHFTHVNSPVYQLISAGEDNVTRLTAKTANDDAHPLLTALQEESFNIDNLVCLSSETATKIAHLVLGSFNLADLLLKAFTSKKFANVMDVLEYSVVKVMGSVAKKYLEINKSTLEKAIRMGPSPILCSSMKTECIIHAVDDIYIPTSTEQYSNRSYHLENDNTDEHCLQTSLCEPTASSNFVKCLKLNESEFVVEAGEPHRPTASTPKSRRRNDHCITFSLENSDIKCEYGQVEPPASPNTGYGSGVEPNLKPNGLFVHNPRSVSPEHFRSYGIPYALSSISRTVQNAPRKYPKPLIKAGIPAMTQGFQIPGEEICESVKRIAESDERFYQRIQQVERFPYQEETKLSNCNGQNWQPDFRQSLHQLPSNDHNFGVRNAIPAHSGSQFQTNNLRSVEHLPPITSIGNDFVSRQHAGKNFLPNVYSSNFHHGCQGPVLAPYQVYPQQPLLYHPGTNHAPTFQTPKENFGESFPYAFHSKINPRLVHDTVSHSPHFHSNNCSSYSHDNFVYSTSHYPLNLNGNHFHLDQYLNHNKFFRPNERQPVNSNSIPIELANKYINFMPTTSAPYLNLMNKPSLRSSISVMRGRDEDFEDLGKYSEEMNLLTNSRQSEPWIKETIKATYSSTGTKHKGNVRKQPQPETFHASFSADSLNLSVASNDVFTKTGNYGRQSYSQLLDTWVSCTESEIGSFSWSLSENSKYQSDMSVTKNFHLQNFKIARFPLLCGDLYNQYDVVNQYNIGQQNLTSPIDIPLSINKYITRLCTSSLPYELETNYFARETETKIHNNNKFDLQYARTTGDCSEALLKDPNSFDVDTMNIDSLSLDSLGEFVESSRIHEPHYSTQNNNYSLNSYSVLTQYPEDLQYLELDAEFLHSTYRQDLYGNSTQCLSSAKYSDVSSNNKIETKRSKVIINFPKINQASVACQRSNEKLLCRRENKSLEDSENAFFEMDSMEETCSYTDMLSSCEKRHVINKTDYCNSKAESNSHIFSRKFHRNINRCFCNHICLHFFNPMSLQQRWCCSRIFNRCKRNVSYYNSCQKSIYSKRHFAVNHRQSCKTFRSHDRQSSRICKSSCRYSRSSPLLKEPRNGACKFATNYFIFHSKEVFKNRLNCCVQSKNVSKHYDKLESSCESVCVCLHASNLGDKCTVDSSSKARKSLFAINGSLEESLVLNRSNHDGSTKIQNRRNVNELFLIASLPDYCEIKRKLSLFAHANQNLTAPKFNACMSTTSENSAVNILGTPNCKLDMTTFLASISSARICSIGRKNIRGTSQIKFGCSVTDPNFLDTHRSNLFSAPGTREVYKCNTKVSKLETGCRDISVQDCAFSPTTLQNVNIAPAHLRKSTALASSHNYMGVAHDRIVEQQSRVLDKCKRFTALDNYISARNKLIEPKYKEPFHPFCMEKSSVRKLVSVFEGLSVGKP